MGFKSHFLNETFLTLSMLKWITKVNINTIEANYPKAKLKIYNQLCSFLLPIYKDGRFYNF